MRSGHHVTGARAATMRIMLRPSLSRRKLGIYSPVRQVLFCLVC
jgi:hypothetical protein